MRNPERIRPIIALVEQYWLSHPDYRFGQMIQNLMDQTSRVGQVDDIWLPEDDKWKAWIQMVLKGS